MLRKNATILLLLLTFNSCATVALQPAKPTILPDGATWDKENRSWYYKDNENVFYVFYENGVLSKRCKMIDGKLNGKVETWNLKGNKEAEGTYVDDKLEGDFFVFWPSGRLAGKGRYQNHLKVGEWQIYNENGTINTVQIYKDGELISEKEYDQ